MTFNRIVMSAIAVLLLGYIPVVGLVIILLYWLGVVVGIGSNLRTQLRRRYRIPAACCPRVCDGRCNDCLCMLACGCCATIQMARQTHNDLEYPGYCCTTTGLPADAPRLL
jgi:Cys-rich protein (TIGR01571 family)